MAANTTPIFPLTPKVEWGTITTANNIYDGTGTIVTVFTAGANGGKVDYVKARALGTNVATLVRFFINNGGVNSTATNNVLFMERALAATTASATSETADWMIPLNVTLPAGYKINAVLSTTVASGWVFTSIGGDY